MRKLILFASLVFAGAFGLTSCNDIDPVAVQENNVPNGIVKTKFIYSVHVVPSSEQGGRVAGLAEAEVTVSQFGKATTKKTKVDGMAIFEGLVEGKVTVYVKAPGFAAYNAIETLAVDASNFPATNDNTHEVTQSASTYVELPILGAAVKGQLYWDNDLVGTTTEVPANGFRVKLTYPSTIQPNVYYATVGADGAFLFSNVPDGSGLSVNVSADTTITIGSRFYTFALGATSASPKVGDAFDLGLLKAGVQAASGTPIKTTATVRFRAYGDFDFKMPSSTFNNTNTTIYDEGLPSGTVVTLDFSVDPDFATDSKGLVPAVYTATPNAEGILVFNNLPVGYTFNIKYSLPVNVELAIGKDGSAGQLGVRLNSSEVLTKLPSGINLPTPATTFGGTIPTNQDDYKVSKVAYTQTFVLSKVPTLDKSNLADGEVRDYGLVELE